MTEQTAPTGPRRSRRGTVAIIVVLLLVIAAVTAVGLLTARAAKPGSTSSPTTTSAAGPSTSATPFPLITGTPKPVKTSSTSTPTPQPTKTATISKPTPVPIKKELTASVVKMAAVTGTADGPGEIGGPSVRFTITIKNTTGKTFSLTNTVVNAYYGSAQTPAVPLRMPGGKNFPASVKNGASATGVYLFNIPKKDRGSVRVTVDTSVQDPVIAFQGAAPRS